MVRRAVHSATAPVAGNEGRSRTTVAQFSPIGEIFALSVQPPRSGSRPRPEAVTLEIEHWWSRCRGGGRRSGFRNGKGRAMYETRQMSGAHGVPGVSGVHGGGEVQGTHRATLEECDAPERYAVPGAQGMSAAQGVPRAQGVSGWQGAPEQSTTPTSYSAARSCTTSESYDAPERCAAPEPSEVPERYTAPESHGVPESRRASGPRPLPGTYAASRSDPAPEHAPAPGPPQEHEAWESPSQPRPAREHGTWESPSQPRPAQEHGAWESPSQQRPAREHGPWESPSQPRRDFVTAQPRGLELHPRLGLGPPPPWGSIPTFDPYPADLRPMLTRHRLRRRRHRTAASMLTGAALAFGVTALRPWAALTSGPASARDPTASSTPARTPVMPSSIAVSDSAPRNRPVPGLDARR